MPDPYRVITPENIELNYEIAGIGSRFVAVAIDTLIQSLTLAGLFFFLSLSGFKSFSGFVPNFPGSLLVGAMILLSLFIWFGYFVIFELIMNGQTLGKRIMHLRVRKDQGFAPSFWDILLRNIIRVVDFMPSFYIIGLITMFLDSKSKRLGDFAAGTIVVKELPKYQAQRFLTQQNAYQYNTITVEPSMGKLSWLNSVSATITEPEYLLIKNLFYRQNQLTNFQDLAVLLVQKIAQKTDPQIAGEMLSLSAPGLLLMLIQGYEQIHLMT